MSDAGLGAAGRRARPSVRRRDGERLSCTKRTGDPIPVEGEPQADPDRAPTPTRVPQGEPPGRGGPAARCRRQVARRGVGFDTLGTPRVAVGVPANSVVKCPSFRHIPLRRRSSQILAWQMTNSGHEERFRPPRLDGRCRFGQATFIGTHGNERDAPKAAVRRVAGGPAVGSSSIYGSQTLLPLHPQEEHTYAYCLKCGEHLCSNKRRQSRQGGRHARFVSSP